MCTVRPNGGLCSRYATALMISASRTMPGMAPDHVGLPWLGTASLVAPSAWGGASHDVTLVAACTQQHQPCHIRVGALHYLSQGLRIGGSHLWG